MNFEKNLTLFDRHNFSTEFKIKYFKYCPCPVLGDIIRGSTGNRVFLSVQGKGELLENKDYVIFCTRRFDNEGEKSWPRIVICTCIVHILNVKGEKKYPRTFNFHFITERYEHIFENSPSIVEERYIERRSILDNESEYLEENTLTVLVEGTQEEWADAIQVDWTSEILYWIPSLNISDFKVEQTEKTLEVYLRKYSVPSMLLCKHSPVFKDMWETPMRESLERRVLLRNDELPAFLCMLFSLVNKKIVLYEVTILDLYKIADKYDIPILLEECRKYMEKYLPQNASAIEEIALCYYDKKLQRTAKSYLEKHNKDHQIGSRIIKDSSSEVGDESDNEVIWDTCPFFSNLIKSKEGFEKYLSNLRGKWSNLGPFSSPDYIPNIRVVKEDTDPKLFDFYS